MASQWSYSWPAASAPSSSSHPGPSYLPSWSVSQSQQEAYLSSNRTEPLQHQLREEAPSRVNPPRPPRLRRRSCTVYGRNFHRVALKHTQAWSIIARLTSEHIESWEEEKRLRSGRHSDLDIYAIYRLSGNVEQPHRHRVRNILRRVLDFRQLQQPKINLLLRLPWLSHPHYQRSTREVLRRLVLDHRNWALPFHLPSTKLAETPHPRVHTVMWNFSSFQDCYLLTSAGPSSCQCAAWLKRQPWLSHVQGHVAAGLDEFRFPGTPQHVHYTSALASYYVDLSVYEVQVHERLRKWCLHHGLPLDQFHAPLMQRLRSEFLKHRQHASTHQLLTKHQLNILHRHLGQDFVCHNEDHDNHHLMFVLLPPTLLQRPPQHLASVRHICCHSAEARPGRGSYC